MPNDPYSLLNAHIAVSHETVEKLSKYHNTLLKWQKKINLIGKDTIDEAWTRHFLDSLQLVNYIDDKNKVIVDLGSGAGFPGMALAIAGYNSVHLIESDARKVAFLLEISRITATKLSIHHCRIEDNPVVKIDIFTSRACASLDKLLHLIAPFLSHETICLFHKGKNYAIENEEALLHWQYNLDIIPSIASSEGVILKLSNIRKA